MSIIIIACEGMSEATITPEPSATNTPAPVAKSIKANLQGVQINMRVPSGWTSRKMEDGIFLAEYRSSFHNIGKLMGMQVYVFVHGVEDFPRPINSDPAPHPALHILQHIITDPSIVGDSAVSDPQPFSWDGNDAAYYLMNDPHENVSLVMAVVVPNESQLVAINISCPSDRADTIREALPNLLADLWVNGALLNVSGIDALPDPLVFPTYIKMTATPK